MSGDVQRKVLSIVYFPPDVLFFVVHKDVQHTGPGSICCWPE
jgi:hypothetical protein